MWSQLICIILTLYCIEGMTKERRKVVQKNFISGGQRSWSEMEKVQRKLSLLRKYSSKELQKKHQPFLLWNEDNEISLHPPSEEAMNELSLNEDADLQAFLYQGDIALTLPQLNQLLFKVRRIKRLAVKDNRFPSTKWPKNRVAYFWDPSLPFRSRERILDAMRFWEENTCIRFDQDRRQKPAIRIFYGSGCWSYVGRQDIWDTQDLSIGRDCELHFGVLTHELMHSIGFYHEHARKDRDEYIYLNSANILKGQSDQFRKELSSVSINSSPYEYGSVMHYPADLYARDRSIPVIYPRDNRQVNTIGQRVRPSFFDIKQVNDLYECHESCKNTSLNCLHGGYPHPNDCSRCLCPYGFAGIYCDELEQATPANTGCGEILEATSTWQTVTGNVTAPGSRWDFLFMSEKCFWQFKAPEDKRISIKIEEIDSICMTACSFNSLEIKTGLMNTTGIRICCDEEISRPFVSVSNIAVVGAFARAGTTSFKLQFIAH